MALSISPEELASAFATLGAFAERGMLTLRVSDLEHDLAGRTREEASNALTSDNITPALLQAALGVKRVAGEINVIVHAFGILVSLPYVL